MTRITSTGRVIRLGCSYETRTSCAWPVFLQSASRQEALNSRIAGTNFQSVGRTGSVRYSTPRMVRLTCIGECALIAAGRHRPRLPGRSPNSAAPENCGKVVARNLTSLPKLTSLTISCGMESVTCVVATDHGCIRLTGSSVIKYENCYESGNRDVRLTSADLVFLVPKCPFGGSCAINGFVNLLAFPQKRFAGLIQSFD